MWVQLCANLGLLWVGEWIFGVHHADLGSLGWENECLVFGFRFGVAEWGECILGVWVDLGGLGAGFG